MKNLMFAFAALMISFSVVSAAPVWNNAASYDYYPQDTRVKIDPKELPDAVKTVLDGDEYTGWEVKAAYKDTEKGTFEVELTNGAGKVTQKFNKEGTKIDE